MHRILKLPLTSKHLITSLILFTLPNLSYAEKEGPVVVTIKPLYSLVAQLTEGIEKPVLLMKQMQSPHHYTMRPSERRLLADARMIIWTGPQMESYLNKIIRQQDATIVTAIQSNGLKLLDRRSKSGHQHTEEDTKHGDASVDPHIWLSMHNAIAISRHISQQLIISDSLNRERYEKNLQRLENKITLLSAEIKTHLDNNKQAFITYHDAFQYFEDENQLNHADTISYDEESGVSLKHLRQIIARIKTDNIKCLVYQPPKPDLIDTLTDETAVKSAALDPLGQYIDDENDAWFILMRDMARNFKSCLTP